MLELWRFDNIPLPENPTPEDIVNAYFDQEISFQQTIARLQGGGLTNEEIDELMIDIALTDEDPFAENIVSIIDLMDTLEGLNADLKPM